jgi:hypothetical protein
MLIFPNDENSKPILHNLPILAAHNYPVDGNDS